jgi:RNA-binding protein
MPLTESRKKLLRGLGHKLKPAVTVGGAGVSEALVREFDATITHHELVKVRVRVGTREARDAAIAELARRGGAELVTRIGNVALFYRPNPDDPKVQLP